jgi:hypothetical protein
VPTLPDAQAAAPLERDGGAQEAACEAKLGEGLIEHACLHATFGPFAEVRGASDTGSRAPVDRPHTAYRVSLAEEAGEVSYAPARTGAYAFFTDVADTPSVLSGMQEGAPVARHPLSVEGCELRGVVVHEVAEGETYTVRLQRPTSGAPVLLLIEALDPFGAGAWQEECP